MKSLNSNGDISLSLKIDPSFVGILRGYAQDESEGCILSGELIMIVHRNTKVRCLESKFVGEISVNFKTTNSMGVPTADGIESRIICRSVQTHFNQQMINDYSCTVVNSTNIRPGTYKFPFSFNIPGSLPHSFQGKHGSIRYEIGAYAYRTLLNSDVHVSRPIILRRSLMDNFDPVAPPSQVVTGRMHSDILSYSATAPYMVYCEGGLLTMDLSLQLRNPEKYSVAMVTCGLQEKTSYRTTGLRSLTNQKKQNQEKSFPLGCSTFYPSEHKNYNPNDLQNYNAMFRLCPRIHTDNRSSLIVVQHRLIIKIIIEEREVRAKTHNRQKSTDSTGSTGSSSSAARAILSHLTLKQHDHPLPKAIPIPNRPQNNSSSVVSHTEPISTPPLSQSPSSDEFSTYSTSTESAASTTSLAMAMEQINLHQPSIVRVTSRKVQTVEQGECSRGTATVIGSSNNNIDTSSSSATNNVSNLTMQQQQNQKTPIGQQISHSLSMHHNFKPLHFHRNSSSSRSIECCLKVPIIVTSREEYREGSVPAIPDYDTTVNSPPNYRTSIQNLPPVPIYPPATGTLAERSD